MKSLTPTVRLISDVIVPVAQFTCLSADALADQFVQQLLPERQ